MKRNDKFLIKNFMFTLLLPVILIFNSCGSTSSTESEIQNQIPYNFSTDSFSVVEVYELIYGKWNWTHSITMQRSIHPPDNKITPFTEGYSMQRKFEPNKQVDNYKNYNYIDTQSYEISRYKVLETDSGKVTVIHLDSTPYRLHFFNQDMMMIGNGGLDGVDNYYVRIE